MDEGLDDPALNQAAKTAVIVLGAGLGRRFDAGAKLAADLAGTPVALHCLRTLEQFSWGDRILVAPPGAEWGQYFADAGYNVVRNAEGALGMARSLWLGVGQVRHCSQALIFLADMPLISPEHLTNLLEASRLTVRSGCATSAEGYRGPPAIFSRAALQCLPRQGEGGARTLLAKARLISCPRLEVSDVDTVQDLSDLQMILQVGEKTEC